MHLEEGGEGFDFLGFHHRLVRGRTPKSAHLTFLARWPSRKAVQHARDRIREITGRERLLLPAEWIVEELNMFLRGWAGYFRYGNSARVLGQIRNYALERLALWLSKKGNRRRAWGWGIKQVLLSPDHLGLIILDGTVIPPRPFRPWRGTGRTPTVKNVGKPCAGEPHARFDGRGLETEPRPAETAPVPDPPHSGRDLRRNVGNLDLLRQPPRDHACVTTTQSRAAAAARIGAGLGPAEAG